MPSAGRACVHARAQRWTEGALLLRRAPLACCSVDSAARPALTRGLGLVVDHHVDERAAVAHLPAVRASGRGGAGLGPGAACRQHVKHCAVAPCATQNAPRGPRPAAARRAGRRGFLVLGGAGGSPPHFLHDVVHDLLQPRARLAHQAQVLRLLVHQGVVVGGGALDARVTICLCACMRMYSQSVGVCVRVC